MVGLTAKEKVDLNQAILEYLIKNGFNQSASSFQEEAKVEMSQAKVVSVAKTDVLERKWKGLAKLKKENLALEKLNK